MPTFRHERDVIKLKPGAIVAGIDEAGRGPLAGPVTAAAVILDQEKLPRRLRRSLDDSKQLTHEVREELFAELHTCGAAAIGCANASVEEIDRINILQATFLAMRRALEALNCAVDHALVDGNRPPPLPCAVTTVIGGDGQSLSIAAASIVAKVTRDRLMLQLAAEFPAYCWHTNMGYGTPEHYAALTSYGVTRHHRRSFAPVRMILAPEVLLEEIKSEVPA